MEEKLSMETPAKILEALAAEPKNLWKRILVIAVVLVIAAWGASSVNFNGVTQSGAKIAGSVINGILHPNTELLFGLGTDGVPYLVLQTIAIAILGTVFGALLAVPVSFLSATNIVPRPVAMVFRALVLFIRTIPSLMWALIWIRVTGPGAFCGVVTQSICSIGMVSKMYITAIENLDTGILESLDAAGCNTFEKIRVGPRWFFSVDLSISQVPETAHRRAVPGFPPVSRTDQAHQICKEHRQDSWTEDPLPYRFSRALAGFRPSLKRQYTAALQHPPGKRHGVWECITAVLLHRPFPGDGT